MAIKRRFWRTLRAGVLVVSVSHRKQLMRLAVDAAADVAAGAGAGAAAVLLPACCYCATAAADDDFNAMARRESLESEPQPRRQKLSEHVGQA